MHCSGCGKDIPFGGEVCPFCQRDKSSDQVGTIVGGIALLLGGFIGNAIAGFGGMIVGGFMLGLFAAIVMAVGKGHSARKPPRVRVEHPPSAKAATTAIKPAPEDTAAARLKRLDKLKEEGLLNDGDYEAQRRTIIASL